jgi:hypothetical protein
MVMVMDVDHGMDGGGIFFNMPDLAFIRLILVLK